MFRDMFSNSSSLLPSEVNLPVDADVLHCTLKTLHKPDTFKEKLSESIITVIKFAISYELKVVARNLLFNACAQDPLELRFEAFVLACQLDDPITGCRILRKAGSGEPTDGLYGTRAGIGKSLRPSSEKWTIRDSERLTHLWLSALANAVTAAERMQSGKSFRSDTERQHQDYWMIVCGEFIHQVTKCK